MDGKVYEKPKKCSMINKIINHVIYFENCVQEKYKHTVSTSKIEKLLISTFFLKR